MYVDCRYIVTSKKLIVTHTFDEDDWEKVSFQYLFSYTELEDDLCFYNI